MAFYLQNKAIVIVFYRYPQGPYSTNVGLADRPDGFEASIPSQYTGYLHGDIVTGKIRAMKTTQIGKMKFSHLGMLVCMVAGRNIPFLHFNMSSAGFISMCILAM